MSTITISIIAHNEAENIERCLNSLLWADEIVVVDCESEDNTAQLAQKYTAKIFQRENNPNLNVNKEFAISKATSDWVFYLDPDEVLTPALADEIKQVIQGPGDRVGYWVKRKNYFFGKWLKHGGKYPDYQLRLFKRGRGRFPKKHLHERLQIDGPLGCLKEPFEHHPYNSLSQLLKKFDFYTTFEACYMKDQGIRVGFWNTLRFLILLPLWRFFQRYFLKLGFLDGVAGFIACVFDSLNFIVRYAKLWELERKRS